VQLVGQLALLPPQTYGEHDGFPMLPAAKRVHVPSKLATSQRSHPPPLQAELQQYPSMQLPLVQSAFVVQAAPLANLNVAVTLLATLIVTLHVAPEQSPLHPAKL
jgi:hypothetical protein